MPLRLDPGHAPSGVGERLEGKVVLACPVDPLGGGPGAEGGGERVPGARLEQLLEPGEEVWLNAAQAT